MTNAFKPKGLMAILCPMTLSCSGYSDAPIIYDRFQPRTHAEVNFAKHVLNEAQILSFQDNKEYCGYIGIDEAGIYVQTPFTKGKENHCEAKAIDDGFIALASFHTHGAFSEDHNSEMPSSDDLKADIMEGLDGYISTPGGRLWYSDAETKTVRLICEEHCLNHDINYKPFPEATIKQSYTLDQLINSEF